MIIILIKKKKNKAEFNVSKKVRGRSSADEDYREADERILSTKIEEVRAERLDEVKDCIPQEFFLIQVARSS